MLEDHRHAHTVPGSKLPHTVWKQQLFRCILPPAEFGSMFGAEAKADGFLSHCTGRGCLLSTAVRLRMTSGSCSTEVLAVNFPKYTGNRVHRSHNRRYGLGNFSKTCQTEEEDHAWSPYRRGHLTVVVTNPISCHGTPPYAPMTNRQRILDCLGASLRLSPLLTQHA